MSDLVERLKGESLLYIHEGWSPALLNEAADALEQAQEKIALLTRTIETLVKEQEKTGQI